MASKFGKKKRSRDNLSPLKIAAMNDNTTMVSVLIPGDDSDKFLLTNYGEKGWFLPFGNVDKSETVKIAACRIASEVNKPELMKDQ